jgi:hypothetical protein
MNLLLSVLDLRLVFSVGSKGIGLLYFFMIRHPSFPTTSLVYFLLLSLFILHLRGLSQRLQHSLFSQYRITLEGLMNLLHPCLERLVRPKDPIEDTHWSVVFGRVVVMPVVLEGRA